MPSKLDSIIKKQLIGKAEFHNPNKYQTIIEQIREIIN